MITKLRAALHACPETSGCEHQTRELLIQFLRTHTNLELHPCGEGFYAAFRVRDPRAPGIVLRADYDAVALPKGGAAHLCGHDGHAAALCGTAIRISEQAPDRNVFFLFQPAEETGAGALPCTALLAQETVSEIYGIHNLPGFPLGQILVRPGTFACGSTGVILCFSGRKTHAAYPENGISPAPAVGHLLSALPQLADPGRYRAMALCTVIGCRMGEQTFGTAAEAAEIWLTLRAELDEDMSALYHAVTDCAAGLAAQYGLRFSVSQQDVFPATINDSTCADKVLQRCGGSLLETPMRWSEDFGHYLQRCPGAFFGIGAGESHPPLHTPDYEYPDALLDLTIRAFLSLIPV